MSILSSGPPRSGLRLRAAMHIMQFLALACVAGAVAVAQPSLEISSVNQSNSNPNELNKNDKRATSAGDFLGNESVWLGYAIRPSQNLSITPSYSLGLTLWGRQSEQNIIEHTLSVALQSRNTKLFGYREPAPAAGTPAASNGSSGSTDALVAQLDAVADMLDSVLYTRPHAGTPPAPAPTPPAQTGAVDSGDGDGDADDLDDLEGDLFDDDDAADDDSLQAAQPAPSGTSPANAGHVPADSILARIVDRLDNLSDTLDLFSASAESIRRVGDGVRQVASRLRGELGSDPAAREAARRLDGFLSDLAKLKPDADDDSDDASETDEEASELLDDGPDAYAPLSLSHQSLIRNSRDDYFFYTTSSDAGADQFRLNGTAGIVRYLNTTDSTLLQYNSTSISATAMLEQRLSAEWSVWGSYTLTSDQYPNAPLFSSTQHDIVAQFRYVPSEKAMVVLDAGAGFKNYANTVSGAQSGDASVIADTAGATSLLTFGAGVFLRPGPNTVLGGALGYQSTPELHPRLTLGFSGGLVRALSDGKSSLSDDPFSWKGSSIQLVAMQMFPLDILASLNLTFNHRDYGRPTVTVANRTVELRDRVDSRTTFELNLSHDFSLNESGSSVLTLNLMGGTVQNSSTNYARAKVTLPSSDFTETYLEFGLSWAPF
ncbi:MAG TPA: hypothetical protein VHI13_13555 [Candidatus Kapabacteria bacterium]|nr:hypothetical protein [Candidatus Kapabacteria bacterium]